MYIKISYIKVYYSVKKDSNNFPSIYISLKNYKAKIIIS